MGDRDIILARLLLVQIGPLRDIARCLELKPSNRDKKIDLVYMIANELLKDRRE